MRAEAEPEDPEQRPLPMLPGFREMALRRMAGERRRLVAELAAQRQSAGLSQTQVAARMRTSQSAVARIEAVARRTRGVAHTITISGQAFVLQANSPTFATMFVVLEPFEKRRSPDLRDTAIMARLRPAWAREVKDARSVVFGAAPIPGISVAGGFKVVIEDRGGLGPRDLQEQTDRLIRRLDPRRFSWRVGGLILISGVGLLVK